MPYYERASRHPMPPANIGTRWVARLIDTLMLGAVAWVVTKLTRQSGTSLREDEVLAAGLYFAYETAFVLAWGATPGKRITKLAVATYAPGYFRPAAWQIVVRAAVLTLPTLLPFGGDLVGLVVVLPILWDGLGLHDRAAQTMVVGVGAHAPPDAGDTAADDLEPAPDPNPAPDPDPAPAEDRDRL